MDDLSEMIGVFGPSRTDAFVLARLERFAGLVADPRVQELPAWHHLARWAAMSAFGDCLRLGLRDEALLILKAASGERPHGT